MKFYSFTPEDVNAQRGRELAQKAFGPWINRMTNPDIEEFVCFVFDKAPAYFWLVPSSSTGKYHPPQSNGQSGLVRHTAMVCTIAETLARIYSLEDEERDILIAGCLLHDIVKYGFDMQNHTTKNHDDEGARWVWKLAQAFPEPSSTYKFESFADKEEWLDNARQICGCIAWHFGQWTQEERRKKFPAEYAKLEELCHVADCVAANKELAMEKFIHSAGSSIGVG